MKIHVVQKGDTLWKIAKKYGVNFEELKNMNTQLSNPDMIMPGMKIKVPTGNVPVKKEVQKNVGTVKESVKKEAPIAPKEVKEKVEHPYIDKTPKPMPVVEEIQPVKEVKKEKKAGPYIPKMPQPTQPVEIDINNYNMMNMTMPQAPKVPQAPQNILPGMMAPEEEELPEVAGVQEELPEVPKQIPSGFAPPPPQPAEYPCVPISPVLPGSGLGEFACPPPPQCPPFPYQGPQMQGYGGYPVPGYQQPVSPEMFDDVGDDLPPQMPNAPHGMGLGQPGAAYPYNTGGYGGYPQTPYPQGVNPEMFDEDDIPEAPGEYPNFAGAPHQGYGIPGQQFGAPHQGYGVPGQQYGAPHQGYGVPGQQFGVPGQQYGIPHQGYGVPGQQYGIPHQGYGVPGQQYGTPHQGYGIPGQQFGRPHQGYGVPEDQEYGNPHQGYEVPENQQYGPPPQPGYGVPEHHQFGQPHQGYGVPGQQYGTPHQGYGVPGQQFGLPHQGYGVPGQQFGPPQQGYGVPGQQQFGTPQHNYGVPGQHFGGQPGFPHSPGGFPTGVNPYQQMPFNQQQNPMFAMPEFDDDDFDD